MAGSFNHIVLVGNLVRDPEIRYVESGKAVTKFSLAINRKSKGGDETMYIDIVAWDRLGEISNQYLKKGASTLIAGRLAIRDYTNKDGEKRKAIEVVASDMQMLGSKRDSGDDGYGGGGSRSGFGSRGSGGSGMGGGAGDGFDEYDEEIPF